MPKRGKAMKTINLILISFSLLNCVYSQGIDRFKELDERENRSPYVQLVDAEVEQEIFLKTFYFKHDRLDIILDLLEQAKLEKNVKHYQRLLTNLRVELRLMIKKHDDYVSVLEYDRDYYDSRISKETDLESIKRYVDYKKEAENKIKYEKILLEALEKIELKYFPKK
jgi:hypothetical protein